jgi:uncharacterized protein (DUF362 family)/Pyruvate/2-oxoacid:ferredoxin oxidoreductase delta subunit
VQAGGLPDRNNMATVTFENCKGYDAPLDEPLKRLLGPLGGMQAYVQPGQSVLIKPNMLTDRSPEEAVTTHPEVVRAVIRAVRECGGRPSVADSPASAVKLEQVWRKTGFQQMCQEEDTPLLNLERAGSVAFAEDGFSFFVAKPVVQSDVLISVPKVKTHVLTTFTAAVKNLYGTLPGYQKAQLHEAYPRPADFGRLLSAIHSRVKPALNIADGIVGMEGDGPSAGSPVRFGFLASSDSAIALDTALCALLGIPISAVPYLTHAPPAAREFQMAGAALPRLAVSRVRVPSTLPARLFPKSLVRLLQRFLWVRPQVCDACIRCGRCVESCPAGALVLESADPRPRLTPEKCIGCCCCHEICPPKAIRMTLSPLLNFMRRGRPL